MTWLSLPVIFCAYLLGRMGGVLGVVVVGAAVLIITILEVLRYFGFSVSVRLKTCGVIGIICVSKEVV